MVVSWVLIQGGNGCFSVRASPIAHKSKKVSVPKESHIQIQKPYGNVGASNLTSFRCQIWCMMKVEFHPFSWCLLHFILRLDHICFSWYGRTQLCYHCDTSFCCNVIIQWLVSIWFSWHYETFVTVLSLTSRYIFPARNFHCIIYLWGHYIIWSLSQILQP